MPVNTFGDFDYDLRCFLSDTPEGQDVKTRKGGRVGMAGGYSGGGIPAPTDGVVAGIVGGSRLGTLTVADVWTELSAGHAPGTTGQLRVSYLRPDRYRWAESEGVHPVKQTPPIIGGEAFEAQFYFADPFFYHLSETGPQSLTVGASDNVGVVGTAQTPAQITLTVTHPGTISVSHAEGTFKLIAHNLGTYAVENFDMRGQWVKWNTDNYWHDWDGCFPYLNPGTNSVGLTVTHGTVSTASIRFTNRDY